MVYGGKLRARLDVKSRDTAAFDVKDVSNRFIEQEFTLKVVDCLVHLHDD